MSLRSLDLLARKPRPAPRQTVMARGYPDIARLLEPTVAPAQPQRALVRTPAARTPVPSRVNSFAKRTRVARSLKTVRRNVLRSGISWFLVLAVGSTSAIGGATIVQHGRVAQQVVTADASAAEASLKEAALALTQRDLEAATSHFADAGDSFSAIGAELDQLDGVLRAALTVWPGNPLGSGQALADAGVHLATAGRALVTTLERFNGVDLTTLAPPDINAPAPVERDASKRTLSQALAEAEPSFGTVVSELSAAADLLETVDTRSLPTDLRAQLEPLLAELPTVRQDLEQVRGLFGTLADLAGANGARRFAIVFQNPNELRPTGGFMGQFALLKVDDGRVDRLDLKSIYDASGQVQTRRAAPEGLNVISDTFALQDANWFPDFATSAGSLRSFFAETGDPSVDGFVALNPTVVNNLLAITGPVDVPTVDLRITEDNFVEEAQYEVTDKDPEREQAFFPSFAQAFFARVFTLPQERWPELVAVLLDAVVRKDLQVNFESADAQHLAETLGAAGSLPPLGTDGLALVYANIGGGKTDNFVEEQRALTVTVGPTSIRHELTVTRTDTRTDEFKDRHNRDFVRLYAPAGSRLVQAEGFDADIKELVSYSCDDCSPDPLLDASSAGEWDAGSNTRTYEENGRSVFANWLTLSAGEAATFRIVYDTPRSSLDGNGIQLVLWRQAGLADIPVHAEVVASSGDLRYVSGAAPDDGKAALDLTLDRDRAVGILAP